MSEARKKKYLMKTLIMEPHSKYLSFIEKIVRSTYKSSPVLSLDDLKQVGIIAALKAIKAHDIAYGASIDSYVKTSIKNAIFREAARFYGPYCLPYGILKLASKICKLNLNDDEIARRFNIFEQEVKKLRLLYKGKSVLFPLWQDQEILDLGKLSQREKQILEYRFIRQKSVQEISELLQISRGLIFKIEKKLKKRIQDE